MPETPTLLMTLTEAGAAALLEVQSGGQPVRINRMVIGSAARAVTGDETDVVDPIAEAAIGGSDLDYDARRFDIGAVFEGSALVAEHPVREIGLFDVEDRLIFYWSTDAGSIGSATPRSDYAVGVSITLAVAPLEAIEIVDLGLALDILLRPRVQRLERERWRTLFLAFGA